MTSAPGIDYVLAGYAYGVLSCALAHSLAGLLREARAKRAQRGQVIIPVAQVASIGRLEAKRLRYRPMSDLFTYAADVMPQQEQQFPELLRRLRETARRLAIEKGEITSDDVHDAHPIPDGVDARIMGGVFHPRKNWVRTGQRASKRRDKNHGRWVSTWRLREEVAA